ncbi:MAG TPA: peptidylprolyl isomerase, partial [Fibrobacteraceae bacterium]|nr:peptidylprolyl isomerase [Fibrobacteraceae bacterium]
MLTWINEKAKWIIVVFAVGIVLGLLAMDRLPDQAIQYPIGKVDGEKISYENFDSRLKMIVANRYEGVHLEEEQYSKLRQDLFQSFVRQHLLTQVMEDAELEASVVEMKAEIQRNPDLIRGMVGQEAQQRIYAIQSSATSAEDANQRMQAYIATLPKFLLDSTFDKASFDQWLNTPEAYEWQAMMNYEKDLKSSSIPLKQMQIFVTANLHPTSLESRYNVERRLTDYDLEVAVVNGSDFVAPESSVDSVVISAYFNAFDSFYVEKDLMKLKYAVLPIEPTATDEAKIREYAMTLYFQLTDSTSTTNFEELARITSEDPASAEQGGALGDYTARGAWVKEFEDVAFSLDSGAISEPVRTKYGFHIIQSHGKKTDSTGVELVKASHILLTVTASSETIDSLENIMEDVRTAFQSSENFDAAAKTK